MTDDPTKALAEIVERAMRSDPVGLQLRTAPVLGALAREAYTLGWNAAIEAAARVGDGGEWNEKAMAAEIRALAIGAADGG